MKIQFGHAAILTFALAGTSFAQTDVNPVLDSNDVPVERSDAEDIPPPEPIPTTNPTPPRVNSIPEGEIHAYDFGVSMLSTNAGMKVQGVIVGSRAQAAGVKPNDMIVSVNGNPVGDGHSLKSGQVDSVEVLRNGQVQRLSVPAQRTRAARVETQRAPRTPRATYAVPRTIVSTPPSYRIGPSNGYPPRAAYSYRLPYDRGYGNSGYRAYGARPGVRIGIGIGSGGYRGYPGYNRYRGIGSPYRYGYGYGPSYLGRGYYGGRRGVSISIGGISIGF
jgi:hypothetical protein